MTRIRRVLVLLACVAPALALLLWLLAIPPAPAGNAHGAPLITATSSPPPVFTATLEVMPDRQYVSLGETLVVTLSLTVAEGCQYPVYEARLTQSGDNAPNFSYVDPITHTVGPGVPMPFSYTLRAVAPGYARLDARLYGEENCGAGWIWRYVSGSSPSIKVQGWAYTAQLPVVLAPSP